MVAIEFFDENTIIVPLEADDSFVLPVAVFSENLKYRFRAPVGNLKDERNPPLPDCRQLLRVSNIALHNFMKRLKHQGEIALGPFEDPVRRLPLIQHELILSNAKAELQ